MAKASISVTWDKDIISALKEIAERDNRSISNLSEIVLTEYVKNVAEEEKLKSSFIKAQNFAKQIEIRDYDSVMENLSSHVHLSESEVDFLNKK